MHAPLSPALRVEWRGLASLQTIADEWRALASRALEPNVFYEPAFMLAAAPVFGAGAGAVLVRSAAGRLLGLFPARLERWRHGPAGTVSGWTHPYAPLGTPLVDRDEAETVIAAWLDHLAGEPSLPGLLLMPLVPEQGPFSAALDAVLARSGRRSAAFGRHRRALLEPGAERAGYLDRAMPAHRRKDLRRQHRRLEEIAPVTMNAAAGQQDVAAALKDFLALEASGWKGRAGTAAANHPAIRSFFETAVAALAADGRARIDRLFLDGRAIAALITFLSGDTAWFWKIAYNEDTARYSPGVQLAVGVTERLLADPQIARVDSCTTANHPMIDRIWRERLAICDRLIELKPSLLPFALACQAETWRRTAIAAAKAVRDRLRRRRS
jgi:CelD/BcsL family acetyltransferase involved in cellulose biosynthesis